MKQYRTKHATYAQAYSKKWELQAKGYDDIRLTANCVIKPHGHKRVVEVLGLAPLPEIGISVKYRDRVFTVTDKDIDWYFLRAHKLQII
jgi:hypothetical protein